MPSEMPWSVDSAQVNGRKAERQMAKDRGARLHPNSGAGPEKNDFSTDDDVYEAKNVAKTHTIKGSDIEKLFVNASRQGKGAVYLIHFTDTNIVLEGRISRG